MSVVAAAEPVDLDPLGTAALHRALPGLAGAMDATTVVPSLQAALFGVGSDAVVIEEATAGKAMFLGGEGCRLRYELALREPSSGRRWSATVLGRLWATDDHAAAHLDDLQPLVARVEGRPEVMGFATPAARLTGFGLVVHAFPIDADLPALVTASDPVAMGPALAEALQDPDAADGWRVDVGHYGRRHRCVLRYERTGAVPAVVYGKLCWDHSGAQLVDGFAGLQSQLGAAGVRIPTLLGYRPELGLSLLAELPGTPLLTGLKRPGPTTDVLEAEVAAAGRVAAALHGVGASWGRRRALVDEVADLGTQLSAMAAISPRLAEHLRSHLDAATDAAASDHRSPLGLAHGDFTWSQFLADGSGIGLLDFDSLCQAEPALDLGQFSAYLRLAAAKGGAGSTDLLREGFTAAYGEAVDATAAEAEALRAATARYEVISLLRITVHAWQKLKARRARTALSLLEETRP